jgi:septum formation protein
LKKIVLASASPRRKALLEQIGLSFEVDPSGASEVIDPRADPGQEAIRLSRAKADSIASKHQDALIIAADTFGVLDGNIIGKPRDPADAAAMLRSLSGKMHLVITGYTLLDTSTGRAVSNSVVTRVYFRPLSEDEIAAYVATGEPLDKAGAYAIQGLGAVLVERIDGDYFNVMGLPLCALAENLSEFGVLVL